MARYIQLKDTNTGENVYPITVDVPLTDEEIEAICDFEGDPEGDFLPVATKDVLGCVAVGDGLEVDENGKVSLGVDYIVEQGIDGRWAFRKWNSGIAEAWCTVGSQSYAITNPYGYAYYAYGTMQLPSGLFKGGVHATSDRCGGNSGNGLVQTSIHTVNNSVIGYYVINSSSETLDVDVALNVKGWWK